MNSRSINLSWAVLALFCFVDAFAQATARGQGSMAFNGTYYSLPSITAGTSKLEHTTADVLSGSQQITFCCWIYANGPGENGLGNLFVLDEQQGNAAFYIRHPGTPNTLSIIKSPGATGTAGAWDIFIVDGIWNAVCVRLDFSGDNSPTARVNFTTFAPSGQSPPIGI